MKPSTFRFSNVAIFATGLLFLGTMVSNAQKSSPPSPNSGSNIGKYGLTPSMPSNGPNAPQNNVPFTQQHVSDGIRENAEQVNALCQLALTHSKNANIKKFAHQTLDENKTIFDQARSIAPNGGASYAEPGFDQTRDALQAKSAEQSMKSLSGSKFDQAFVLQMDKINRQTIWLGHSTYAMMEIPRVSPLGWKLWKIAQNRDTQLHQLAKEVHVTIVR